MLCVCVCCTYEKSEIAEEAIVELAARKFQIITNVQQVSSFGFQLKNVCSVARCLNQRQLIERRYWINDIRHKYLNFQYFFPFLRCPYRQTTWCHSLCNFTQTKFFLFQTRARQISPYKSDWSQSLLIRPRRALIYLCGCWEFLIEGRQIEYSYNNDS